MQSILIEKQEAVADLCRRHSVRRLAVFGSAAREDFDPTSSDIDLLVEFEEDIPRFAENYFALEEAFTSLFARRVDLLTFRSIRNPFLKRSIEADQKMLYAA